MTARRLDHKQARSARRRERYAAREVLWGESSLRRVKACGLVHQGTGAAAVIESKRGQKWKPLPEGAEVKGQQVANGDPRIGLKVTVTPAARPAGFVGPMPAERRAGWSGVQSCGSTWACPVCSEKIQAHRQAETEAALRTARERGWLVAFVTFTVRHKKTDSLASVWGAVSDAWRATVSGSRSAWDRDRTDYGVRGYLRLTEVTHGFNGWHVHVHALLFLDPAGITLTKVRQRNKVKFREDTHYPVTADYSTAEARAAAVAALTASMAQRWRGALEGTGFRPGLRHGSDGRLVTLDAALPEYFAKNVYNVKSIQSAAYDVTGSHSKQAKHGNVTPFGILARVVNAPDVLDTSTGELVRDTAARQADLDLWREWERESKGRRQLLWSNGLRALLGLGEEVEDEDVAQDDALDGPPVIQMTPQSYRVLARRGLLAVALDAAEQDDNGHALRWFLLTQGVQYERPDPPGRKPEWEALRGRLLTTWGCQENL